MANPLRDRLTERPTDAVEEPDAMLVERALQQPVAFAPIYRTNVEAIHRYCHRRLGDRTAAEDATSAVFVKAIASLSTYRADVGSVRAWLFGIAHHVVTDALRAHRPDAPWDAASKVSDAGPSPEGSLLAAEEQRSVQALLRLLPPHQRDVLELRLAGLSGPEIARVLGRSQNAVDVAQFRALARLRVLLTVARDQSEVSHGER